MTAQITLTLSDQAMAQAENCAQQLGLSVHDFLVQVIVSHIDRLDSSEEFRQEIYPTPDQIHFEHIPKNDWIFKAMDEAIAENRAKEEKSESQ